MSEGLFSKNKMRIQELNAHEDKASICKICFNSVSVSVTPKVNFRFAIENFRRDFLTLHQKFGISITNKIHIIIDHVEDYISKSGKGLGNITDQTVEALHSALNKLNYWIKDISSEKHGHKLYWGIRHFNSYND